MKRFVNIIMVLFLILGLGVGLYLLQQKYSFDFRKKAGGLTTSQFFLEGPNDIQVNQDFDVQLILDTNGDQDYTISGVDAKISFAGLILKQVQYMDPKTQDNIFDSYPGYTSFVNETTISGIKNYSVDENGYFVGYTGRGLLATLTFEATQPGDYNIHLVYDGESATNDSNINGFYRYGPVSIQKPVERLLIQPNSLNIRALGVVKDPIPTPTPTPTPSSGLISCNVKAYRSSDISYQSPLNLSDETQIGEDLIYRLSIKNNSSMPLERIYIHTSNLSGTNEPIEMSGNISNNCAFSSDLKLYTCNQLPYSIDPGYTDISILRIKLLNPTISNPYTSTKYSISADVVGPAECAVSVKLPTSAPSPINHAPSIDTYYLPSANLDTDYDTTIEAYDDDGDVLTMTAITLPDGIRLTECSQNNYPNTHLTCHLTGKTNSTLANTWSVKIEVKDSKGTITTKYLDLYVSPPQPTWVNWYNDSVRVSGGIDLTINGQKYNKMNQGWSNLSENSIRVHWQEHGLENDFFLVFDHDNENWWISRADNNFGDGKTETQSGKYYVTPLGRPFNISDWSLELNENNSVVFKNVSIQAFANIEYQPEFLTEQLPAGRLFGWYTAAISIEDRNLNDWNSMEFENLPAGLTLGTCATENRSYPPTDGDKNILHCLITGRPASVGDHTITAKIYDSNHNFVSERNYNLKVNLLSVTPPVQAKVIVSHTEHLTNFVVGRSTTLLVEVTNVGGEDAPRVSPTISADAEITPNWQDTCRSYSVLKSGERCFLAYDITFSDPGERVVVIGDLISMLLPVSPKEFIPLPVMIKSRGIHNDGDVETGHISLIADNKVVFEIDAQFIYSVAKSNFIANINVPSQLSGKDLNITIKLQGELTRKFPNPILLNTDTETPIDATSLASVAGDITGDDKINLFDYNEFVAQYGNGKNSSVMTADLNYDGKINIFDYNLLVANYGKQVLN